MVYGTLNDKDAIELAIVCKNVQAAYLDYEICELRVRLAHMQMQTASVIRRPFIYILYLWYRKEEWQARREHLACVHDHMHLLSEYC